MIKDLITLVHRLEKENAELKDKLNPPGPVAPEGMVYAGFRCPRCGKVGNYRSGQEFDHMMRCISEDCKLSPIWVPGNLYHKKDWEDKTKYYFA